MHTIKGFLLHVHLLKIAWDLCMLWPLKPPLLFLAVWVCVWVLIFYLTIYFPGHFYCFLMSCLLFHVYVTEKDGVRTHPLDRDVVFCACVNCLLCVCVIVRTFSIFIQDTKAEGRGRVARLQRRLLLVEIEQRIMQYQNFIGQGLVRLYSSYIFATGISYTKSSTVRTSWILFCSSDWMDCILHIFCPLWWKRCIC